MRTAYWIQTPLMQILLDADPLCMRIPLNAEFLDADPPGHVTCDACLEAYPPWTD